MTTVSRRCNPKTISDCYDPAFLTVARKTPRFESKRRASARLQERLRTPQSQVLNAASSEQTPKQFTRTPSTKKSHTLEYSPLRLLPAPSSKSTTRIPSSRAYWNEKHAEKSLQHRSNATQATINNHHFTSQHNSSTSPDPTLTQTHIHAVEHEQLTSSWHLLEHKVTHNYLARK